LLCHLLLLSPHDCTLFFFYGPGDNRHLHSFPTRRSSDLAASVFFVARRSPQRSRADERFLNGGITTGSMQPAHSVQHRDSNSLADRKSTRLNSSHVKISYAVFCLKKKKKTNTK